MKTGSDLTEPQAFRNHTAHKQLCLLDRMDVDGDVTNSVQSSGLPLGAGGEGGWADILCQFRV